MFAPAFLQALPAFAATREWADDVRSALRAAGISQKRAALEMGVDEGFLARALNAEPGVNLHLRRLAMLPVEFHQHYAVQLAGRYGLPPQLVAAGRLALVLMIRRHRMLSIPPLSKGA